MYRLSSLVFTVALLLSSLVRSAGAAPPGPTGGLRGEGHSRDQHAQQYVREHVDRSGKLRPDIWRAAVLQTKQMRVVGWRSAHDTVTKGARLTVKRRTQTVPITGTQWTQVGPAPLRIDANQNYQGAGPDSGQVTDIAIDPRNTTDSTIYIASNDGGIWKTTDGGTSWTPLTDLMPSLSMGAVALDPTNPSIVYAGTGNQFNNGFSKGIGIYKSTDGGASWNIIGASVLTGKNIQRILVLPGNVVLVASTNGLYRSPDGGVTWGGAVLGGYITDLKADTATAGTVWAAVNGSGLYQSTDSGATFGTPLFTLASATLPAPVTPPSPAPSPTIGYISFAQSTVPNNTSLYVDVATPKNCVKDSSGNLLSGAFCARLYRSTDGGSSWQLLSGTNDLQSLSRADGGCQCGYDQTIGVDPQDGNTLYAGFQELYLSTNGGASFNPSAVSSSKIHWDHHALYFAPPGHWGGSTTSRVFVGEDGGIAASTDQGATWANINEGIATNLFRQIDIGRGSTANNGYTYGGTQDTGIIEHRPAFAGTDWHLGIDGDGGPTAVDPCNAQHAISDDDGGYVQTTNGGTTWAAGTGFPASPTVGVVAFDPNCGTAYADVTTSDGAGNTNVALYQSTNNGSTWGSLTAFPQNNDITAIATDKLDSNVIWLGFTDGSVQKTGDGGTTWSPVLISGRPGAPVGGIALDPANTAQAYVAYTGTCGCPLGNSQRKMYSTGDNGTTWSDISGANADSTQNLPDLPLHSVVIDPGTTPHTIIASNDAAVLRSADNGATWQVLGSGMPAVDVTSLQIDTSSNPALLRAGTYGRSVFELTAANGPHLSVNANLAFGTVAVGDNHTSIVQLFNTGGADLHISSIARVSGSTDFTLSGPPTPVTVTPGEELDYTVKYAPTAPGPATATFQINSDDPSQPHLQLPATGTGGVPVITLSGDLGFGVLARGQTATRTVTVNDTGNAPLRVTSVSFDSGSDGEFSVVGPSTPQVIPAGGHIDFTVQFAPSLIASGAPVAGTLRVQGVDDLAPLNGSATPVDKTMTATGTPGVPKAAVTQGPIAYGSIPVDERTNPHSADMTLRISNQASCPLCDLHVNTITLGGTNPADYSIAPPSGFAGPITIGAGNHLDVVIRFDPKDAGARNASVTVASDDPVNPSVTDALTGTGLVPGISAAPATLIFPPTVYDPQCVPSCGLTQNETITNSGLAELILDTLTLTSNPSGAFSVAPPTNPLTRVVPTGTFGEAVTFHPTGGPARALRGTLHIRDLFPDPADAVSSPVQADVPICGESVGRGIRVLVKSTTGAIVPSVDKLALQSHGLTNPVNIQLKTQALVTVSTGCVPIQYQYENQSLQPAGTASNRGSYYNISVTVGSKHAQQSFTLNINEFKTLTLVVQ